MDSVDAYSNAIKNNDFEAMYSTISPAYQNGMIFQGRFALGSGASSDKAEAILEGAFDTKLLAKLQAGALVGAVLSKLPRIFGD